MNLNAAAKLRRSENVTYQSVAEEAILIRMDTGTYFSLNQIGTEFWEMLDGQASVADHARTIAAKYDVEVDRVVSDLLELADKMAADRLVESV